MIVITAVKLIEMFDFLYEPADIVLKATLFRREAGRGKGGCHLEKPMFLRQAKREGRQEDFMSAEFLLKMYGVTHALPGEPTPEVIRMCAAQALAAKMRIYGRKPSSLPDEEEDECEFRAGAQWIHSYMTSNFIGVIKEAERQGRLPFQVRIESLVGELPPATAMLDEIGVLKIYHMFIPALMDSQTKIDFFTEKRRVGEKRIEAYLLIANNRFLLLRFRNWTNPVSPSTILREAEALQRVWRFLNCGVRSGITVYVCPSIEGGEEAEKKLQKHGVFIFKLPQIQPEELMRQVEEWTGIDPRSLYPSPPDWSQRIKEMILSCISRYLRIPLLKKRKEQFRVVNSPPSKDTPLYEKTECEDVEIERKSWFNENFESEVEKIWRGAGGGAENRVFERSVVRSSFLKTKYKNGGRGFSPEKNGFPLFHRGEVDVYLPFFSIDDDPEGFVPRGLGPPENMDPRLALFLSVLFGEDIYSILRTFHIEEKADRVIVKLASTKKSPARDRFNYIYESARPRYGDPHPPFPGIKAGDDPWTLIIPRSLYVPGDELKWEIAKIGVENFKVKREEEKGHSLKTARPEEEAVKREGKTEESMENQAAERLRRLKRESIVFEDFEWEGRVLTFSIAGRVVERVFSEPWKLAGSGIIAGAGTRYENRKYQPIESAMVKVQRKNLKMKWRWRKRAARIGSSLSRGIYAYVIFKSGGKTVGSDRDIDRVVREVSKRIFGSSKPKPRGKLLIVDSMIRAAALQMWKLKKWGTRRDGELKYKVLERTFKKLLETRRSIINSVFPIRDAKYLPCSIFC
ncbi:hypothetical protein J7M00_02800, partial [bacterium]|nr:hypothetical protein [bacterium]